jgi:hypothetical protein
VEEGGLEDPELEDPELEDPPVDVEEELVGGLEEPEEELVGGLEEPEEELVGGAKRSMGVFTDPLNEEVAAVARRAMSVRRKRIVILLRQVICI